MPFVKYFGASVFIASVFALTLCIGRRRADAAVRKDISVRFLPVWLLMAVSSFAVFLFPDRMESVFMTVFPMSHIVAVTIRSKSILNRFETLLRWGVFALGVLCCAITLWNASAFGVCAICSLVVSLAIILFLADKWARSVSAATGSSSVKMLSLGSGVCLVSLAVAFASMLVVISDYALWFKVSALVANALGVAYHFCAMCRKDDLYLLHRYKAIIANREEGSLGDSAREARCPAPDGYADIRKRFEAYFENEKPYLNKDLSINDVANALYTNKTYLSRMLNGSMGMNFNQIVNKYRVEYAARLFTCDTSLKLSDLTEASGFRSFSTFSLAFRLHLGDAPGEWCRKMKVRLKQSGKDSL